MEKTTSNFLKKIRFNTYIYTFLFMGAAAFYLNSGNVGSIISILLLTSFAFYTIGRQISLVFRIEQGEKVNTKPRELVWVRGITYLIIILLVFSVIFSF